jgi:polysaccharide deacetylase family protein (PEP-CTERM system associated)
LKRAARNSSESFAVEEAGFSRLGMRRDVELSSNRPPCRQCLPFVNRRSSRLRVEEEMINIFSVDVEDYFQPSELAGGVKNWAAFTPRVNVGVDFLLDLTAKHGVRGTFFILGWVAAHHPKLIRKIVAAGHEIGCHSYSHRLVYELTPAQFEDDTLSAIHAIEDAGGVTPRAYRAPSYSVTTKTPWALDILASCGFTHDSSIYPIVHDRYGIPGFDRHAVTVKTESGTIIEVPVATVKLGQNHIAPVGGGAYMRLFPYRYTAAGIRRINRTESKPACMYLHPWEVDPGQPRLSSNLISTIRTYAGLNTMRSKVARLLQDFQFDTMTAVYPVDANLPAIASGFASCEEEKPEFECNFA